MSPDEARAQLRQLAEASRDTLARYKAARETSRGRWTPAVDDAALALMAAKHDLGLAHELVLAVLDGRAPATAETGGGHGG